MTTISPARRARQLESTVEPRDEQRRTREKPEEKARRNDPEADQAGAPGTGAGDESGEVPACAGGKGSTTDAAKLNLTERWLVLAILLGVAIHQFAATANSTLSPWKGGGFGMFAVSDSPGTRFVRAEGITEDGRRIRIDGLEGLEGEVRRRWRSRPLNSQLESLADDLMTREFVRTNLRSVSAIHQLQREVPMLGETLKLEEEGRTRMRFYRTRREDDPIPERNSGERGTAAAIRLKEVELQWWKIEFDSQNRKLRPVPLFPPVKRKTDGGTNRKMPSPPSVPGR